MAKTTTPPLVVRIWCERKRKHYFDMMIFPSRVDMMEFHDVHHKRMGLHRVRRNYEAIASTWPYLKTDPVSPEVRKKKLGHVLFYAGHLGSEIVSHEMTHAAWYWLLRVKPRALHSRLLSPAMQEALAHVQGRLVGQTWTAFYRWQDAGKIVETENGLRLAKGGV